MKNLLSIILLVLVCSCSSDSLLEREFPRIKTLSVENLSTTSVRVLGAITQNSNNVAITEYGVVWSSSSNPNIFGNKIIGSNLTDNKFSVDITTGIPRNTVLRSRAYAITANDIIYGDTVPFELAN